MVDRLVLSESHFLRLYLRLHQFSVGVHYFFYFESLI